MRIFSEFQDQVFFGGRRTRICGVDVARAFGVCVYHVASATHYRIGRYCMLRKIRNQHYQMVELVAAVG